MSSCEPSRAVGVCRELGIPTYGNRDTDGMAYPMLLIGVDEAHVADLQQYASRMEPEYRLEALYEWAGRNNPEVLEKYT